MRGSATALLRPLAAALLRLALTAWVPRGVAVLVPSAAPLTDPVCNARPLDCWPSTTAAASDACWPNPPGRQPWNLECWPTEVVGERVLYVTDIEETPFTTLRSSDVPTSDPTYWVGLCKGLVLAPGVSSPEECENECRGNAECSVWQFRTNSTECYLGIEGAAFDCFSEQGEAIDGGYVSKLVMHGVVVEKKAVTDGQGLLEELSRERFTGWPTDVASEAQVDACKDWCKSSIHCQYWQFSPAGGLPTRSGCWFEKQGGSPRVPLTLDAFNAPAMAESVYLQHYPYQPATVPSRCNTYVCPDGYKYRGQYETIDCEAIPCNLVDRDVCCRKVGWPWWGWLLFALGLLCCYCTCSCGGLFPGVFAQYKARTVSGGSGKGRGRSISQSSSSGSDSD